MKRYSILIELAPIRSTEKNATDLNHAVAPRWPRRCLADAPRAPAAGGWPCGESSPGPMCKGAIKNDEFEIISFENGRCVPAVLVRCRLRKLWQCPDSHTEQPIARRRCSRHQRERF